MIQFSHWTEIWETSQSSRSVCACVHVSVGERVHACVFVCGKHVHHLNVGVFLSLHISLFRYWLTAFLIDPIHTNNGHWSPSTSTSQHTHTLPQTYSIRHTRTYKIMHSNVQLKVSIGTEVSIPQAYVPFTLKARLHQEGCIETCEWLLDIPVETLTVNWKRNMNRLISLDSQCKRKKKRAVVDMTTIQTPSRYLIYKSARFQQRFLCTHLLNEEHFINIYMHANVLCLLFPARQPD